MEIFRSDNKRNPPHTFELKSPRWNRKPELSMHTTIHIRPRIEIRQFTSIYLNLIQKALDCCIWNYKWMGEIGNGMEKNGITISRVICTTKRSPGNKLLELKRIRNVSKYNLNLLYGAVKIAKHGSGGEDRNAQASLFSQLFPIATMCTNKDNDPAHNGVARDFFACLSSKFLFLRLDELPLPCNLRIHKRTTTVVVVVVPLPHPTTFTLMLPRYQKSKLGFVLKCRHIRTTSSSQAQTMMNR